MEKKNTFGEYVREKRSEKGITLRKMAQMMKYSPTYWSDIENGHRNPPGVEKLHLVVEKLELTSDEKDTLFDLAGDFIQEPPPDLTDYLKDPNVRRALRTAKKHKLDSEAWKAFEQRILDQNEGSDVE